MKTMQVNAMQWKMLLMAALLLLPLGCNGPAEEAGEELDEQVEQIRQESVELQQQISDYTAQIAQAREELKTTRSELQAAKKELAELRQQRDQIIAEMESLQQKDQGKNAGQTMKTDKVQPGGQ